MKGPGLSLLCALLLAGLLLPLAGCTGFTARTFTPGDRDNGLSAEEADLHCSYFYFLWGRHAELGLQFEEALEAYEKALICDPGESYLRAKIPLMLLRLERLDAAAALLAQELAARPDDLLLGKLAARVLVRQGKLEQGIDRYLLLREAHPQDTSLGFLLVELYLSVKDYAPAQRVLEQLLKDRGNSYPAHLLLARLFKEQQEPAAALSHYRKAHGLRWSAELLLEIAELERLRSHDDQAIVAYQEILERESDHTRARMGLFELYEERREYQAAVAQLLELRPFSSHPEHVDLAIARLYIKWKKYDQARRYLQAHQGPAFLAESRYLLAQLFLRARLLPEALEQAEAVGPGEPLASEFLLLQARILQLQGHSDQAVIRMEQALRGGDRLSVEVYAALAALYELSGEEAMVRQTYLRATQIFPDNDELLYEFALVLEARGERAQALATMERVIGLNPDHAAALNFVGYTWAEDNVRLDQALDYISRAVALEPDNGYIRDSLGWVYYRLGRLDQALIELEEAARLLPKDPSVQQHLAEVYLQNRQPLRARAALRKALTLYPEESAQYRALQDRLKTLGREGE
ncbi:tetratricopeptide repeat protein [Desulfogranum mediterraneum]|uniref:tetratricopeptide repeat protein n=1 Tax=Desulfogranum mediterraneum TaxID=160661 RepID=UPI00040AD336|nr:tetratricopeptide repeat protein [Desulfogranum mediterraneum]